MLSFCEEAGRPRDPYGGGTSVVGGVEPRLGDRPSVSVDLRRLDRVLEVDDGLARRPHPGGSPRAGARGPAAGARPDAAPLPAVVRVLHLRRLGRDPRRRPLRDPPHPHRRPGRVGARDHAAGGLGEPPPAGLGRRALARPGADRVRGDPRRDHGGLGAGAAAPRAKLSCGVEFGDFLAAAGAVREISQSGLQPSNCRLLDALEAGTTGAGSGERPCSCSASSRPTIPWITRWTWRSRSPGRRAASPARCGARPAAAASDAVAAMPSLALRLPRRALPPRHVRRLRRALRHLRDRDHLGPLRGVPRGRDGDGAKRSPRSRARPTEGEGAPRVCCRFTHVYPDGPAPYFTVLAPGAAAARSSSGTRSRRRPRRRSSTAAARSPTTTRSAATTAPGTTASARPFRRGAARRQGRARPGGDPEPGVLIDPSGVPMRPSS